MIDPTQKDLTAAQIRDHELALQVQGLREDRDKWASRCNNTMEELGKALRDADKAEAELHRLRSWITEIRDLALSGALVAPAAVMARILDDGLRGDL